MREKILDEPLRQAINEFLVKNYGIRLPAEDIAIIEERNEYIHMDPDNDNVIYIPKRAIKIKEEEK